MDFKPLKIINPTNEDMTINSSVWLASRIMPGKGNRKVSFPHYRIINGTGARVCDNTDLQKTALLGLSDNEIIINLESFAGSLVWRGLWTIINQVIIGKGHSTVGLYVPFNTFNDGYRYKNGWRPKRVS